MTDFFPVTSFTSSVVDGNRQLTPASVQVCVCVWVRSLLWVKRIKFELIWQESYRCSGKLNSTVEKRANLNFPAMKVPALWINSIPEMNKGRFEHVRQ